MQDLYIALALVIAEGSPTGLSSSNKAVTKNRKLGVFQGRSLVPVYVR